MIVAVACLKGGVGKSTTAWMLAHLLAGERGPTVAIDGDTETHSLMTWRAGADRNGDTWPTGLTVEWWDDRPLAQQLPRRDLAHVVIDIGPGDRRRMEEAVAVADVVIVPVGARDAEVSQIGSTTDLVLSAAGSRSVAWGVLVTMVEAGTLEARQVPDDLERDGVPLLATTIPYRAPIRRVSNRVPDLDWHRQVGPYRDLLTEIEEATHALA